MNLRCAAAQQLADQSPEQAKAAPAHIPKPAAIVVIITRRKTTERIVRDCSNAGVHRVWIHQSVGKGSSVSAEAVEYCRQHDINVIAGACPMMYGEGADFGHTCMRWILKLIGRLPA